MAKSNQRNNGRIRYDVLGRLCKEHRTSQHMTYREAAVATGISASTLCRLESGLHALEIEQVVTLAKWIGVPVERFAGKIPENLPRAVRAMLYADPKIGREEAEALGGTFSALYRQMANR